MGNLNLWYPPQQEGLGPWIEGPPPLDLDGPFQVLLEDEDRAWIKQEYPAIFERRLKTTQLWSKRDEIL